MTVGKLKEILNQYPDDFDVMTKKTEILGTVGEVNSVRKDTYGFLGMDIDCVILTDEYETEEGEKHDRN